MTESSMARERVLTIAETLFREKGYRAVSMSDLAVAAGMQKASLYHHASGGKEALFVEVMERILMRYQQGLTAAIEAQTGFEAKLKGAASWLLSNPSLHYERMMQSDMPNLSAEHVARLSRVTYGALLDPLEKVFRPEMVARGVDPSRVSYLTGAFLSVIEGIHNLPHPHTPSARLEMAYFLIDTLFRPFGTT